MREDKGKSLLRAVSDYTVIDLETTDRNANKAKIIELSSDPQYKKIETQLENDLIDSIRPYLEQAIKDYKPIKTFACCSRYVECSDAKKCLHPQQIYAKQCWYRDNLENDKIFYGKNKNI